MCDIDDLIAASADEIKLALQDNPREPGWITIKEYADREGISEEQARRDLNKGVAKGKLEKDIRKVDRRSKAVYRIKK